MKIFQSFVIAVLIVFGVAVSEPLQAAERLSLTPELKQSLSALKPLRGTSINNTAFYGRPVLVTFFASW